VDTSSRLATAKASLAQERSASENREGNSSFPISRTKYYIRQSVRERG